MISLTYRNFTTSQLINYHSMAKHLLLTKQKNSLFSFIQLFANYSNSLYLFDISFSHLQLQLFFFNDFKRFLLRSKELRSKLLEKNK